MAQKPLILAVETSSRMGSVAIALGEKILAETAFSGPARHSAELFPAVRQLLARLRRKLQEIEQVHISIGPGSFTGLRISTTLAKTMHLANAAKIIAVDTLDVIAANATDYIEQICKSTTCSSESKEEFPDRIAPILDAKRNQFFIAVYQRHPYTSKNSNQGRQAMSHDTWKKIIPGTLMTAAQFIEKFAEDDKPTWLLGDGLLYHKDKFKDRSTRFLDQKYWSPKAGKVHLLGWQKALAGQFADPVTLVPNYLLRPTIKINDAYDDSRQAGYRS